MSGEGNNFFRRPNGDIIFSVSGEALETKSLFQ
jgi:hypothetical protein